MYFLTRVPPDCYCAPEADTGVV